MTYTAYKAYMGEEGGEGRGGEGRGGERIISTFCKTWSLSFFSFWCSSLVL